MKQILSIILLLSCMTAQAQSVQTDFDSKVIYTDSLNISKANSAAIVLMMLPELLNRPDVNYVTSYDIEIDGMSVGDAGDAALSQLHLSDIERIEVEESPIANYQSNGQGGSINLVLHKRSTPQKPFYGSASLDGSYPIDIYPQLYLGYQKGKFSIRGIALGEWYKTSNDVETSRGTSDNLPDYSQDVDKTTNKINSLGQLARVYMEYNMTDKDRIKLNVSENTSHSSRNAESTTTNERTENITTFQTLFNYRHTFNPHSNIAATVQYEYNPSHLKKKFPEIQTFENFCKSNNISGKVAYQVNLVPLSVTDKKESYSDLEVGVNANKTYLREDMNSTDYFLGNNYQVNALNPNSDAFHIMPYLSSESEFGKFRVKLDLQFQHYEYNMNRLDEPYTNDRNDFTGKFMAEWHFTPHKNLRFIFDRSLERPTDEQIYPVRMYILDRMSYVQGNVDLKPLLSHEFSLNYIADYKWGEHSLVLDVAASYNNVDDIITEYRTQNSKTIGFGLMQEYVTFRNDGTNHIINGDFMAIWQYRFLNVAFTANVFNNKQNVMGESDHYTYYNLSLTPSFNLTHGWKTSLNVKYFSKVSCDYETLGDYASASLNVCKSWGHLKAYVFGRVALTSKTTDTVIQPSDDESVPATVTFTRANIQQNKVGAGVMYLF